MTQYMICFPDGSMNISDEDLPAVSAATGALVQAAEAEGVWVFGAGLEHQVPSIVAVDGTVTDGPYPESKEHLGGFAIVNVPTREEAIEWAKKFAVACRCTQQVFQVVPEQNETHYMICFPDGSMTFPEEDLPDVAAAADAVVQEAEAAGAWVFGAGLEHQVPSIVAPDGTVTDGPYPESKEHLGGFAIVDVSAREAAIEWAKKIAVACRCPQQVFEVMADPSA